MAANTQLSAHVSHTLGDVLIVAQSYLSTASTNTDFVYDPDLNVPALISDLQVSFNTINTARAIFIKTNQPLHVKLNYTGNTPIYVTDFYMVTTEATALFLSNTANTAATVQIVVLGD